MTVRAVGPLRAAVEHDGTAVKLRRGYQLGAGVNPLVVLNRVAFVEDGSPATLDTKGQRALLNWAAAANLGQEPDLLIHAAARRQRALDQMIGQGLSILRLHAVPEWRLAIGLANRANAHEIGLSLHGTYGWPVIPGTSLKGLAAAWAARAGAPDAELAEVFGMPRPRPATPKPSGPRTDAFQGGVRFLDAIPAGKPVNVVVDVLTPHVKPYYDDNDNRVPPAEHHPPVPVNFLTVSGAFAVDLVASTEDVVTRAAEWLTEAADELGAGAKTAAGYGYLHLTRVPPRESRA